MKRERRVCDVSHPERRPADSCPCQPDDADAVQAHTSHPIDGPHAPDTRSAQTLLALPDDVLSRIMHGQIGGIMARSIATVCTAFRALALTHPDLIAPAGHAPPIPPTGPPRK